ncbi:uncharacterized protein LOC113279035 [Papaver somniferum]|uniref:uncharacterized protein LOC113279035 n=1 Tax=Papaver somniferum TaxID=3469 RepID=UPI000E703CE4|nr:uncharacterized protein LOC113279035 [Papaver somniferum]
MHYEAIHNSSASKKGNIWIFWSSSIQRPSIISITDQSITVEVGGALITGVHANTLTVNRRELWMEMEDISLLNKPWLTIGDFNYVLREEENKGVLRPLKISMMEFNNCLHGCGLMQAPHSEIPKPRNIPFKALKVWKNHSGILPLIKESWGKPIQGNPIFIFMSKVNRLKTDIKECNWVVFGDVNKNLKLAEMEVLNSSIASDQEPYNNVLLNKLVTTRGKLEILSQHQNDIIKKKSRVQWLKDGASNTKFFHVNMKVRQAQNMIGGGIESTVPGESAPGPDGFAGWIYKFAWDIVGEDLIDAIRYCWRRNFIPEGLNANFIRLIPKVNNAKKAKQFRPIGLMNFSFKIFTKIWETRLGSIIHKMVSPQQGAFIKGRTIQEQIALASEMVNELNIKRRGGNFGLKIDITQAYDSLSWNFLFQVMSKFGVSDTSIHWLQVLLKSARISVLVNGGPAGYFKVGRWLRQGDPLSPLLFVLAEDALSRNITSMIQQGILKEMVNRKGVKPSNILFTDDVSVFMLVYKWPSRVIKECERIIRNFVWTGDPSKRKQVTLKWNKVCSPLSEGGLGIRRLEVVNKALIMKLFWKIQQGTNEMVKLFQAKFKNKNGDWISYYKKSSIWQGIKWVIAEVQEGTRCLVGNGETISVWKNKWIQDKALEERFQNHTYIQQFLRMKVAGLILEGEWVIPSEMMEMIDINELPALSGGEDKRIWPYTISGNPAISGYGFIGRTHSGEFLIVVSGGLGISTNYYAEILAILNAGEWAVSKGHREVWFRTDSAAAIFAFQSRKVPWFSIKRWEKICASLNSWCFIHSYMEVNFSADGLAKKGANLARGERRVYLSRPEFLVTLEIPNKSYYRFY